MLKCCCDCLAGSGLLNNPATNEAPYGSQLNQLDGDTYRAPPWPKPRLLNEKMFLIPRQLNSGDKITVSGSMQTNPNMLTVSLLTGTDTPDYDNIACHLEAYFQTNSSNGNKIQLKRIKDGEHEIVIGQHDNIPATELFTDLKFAIGFTVSVSGNYDIGHILNIYIGETFLEQILLKHNIEEIKYISLSGDIAKVQALEFEFA